MIPAHRAALHVPADKRAWRRTKTFSEALTKAGIHNVYFESPGTAHEWLTWRRCFNDLAPRLFK